jgi:hypothetical protein
MGSKPSGTTTSTQNTTPWAPQQPYLEDIFTESQGLYQGAPPQYYPGTTTAAINPYQSTGLDMMGNTVYGSSALPATSADFNQHLLYGDYAGQNPADAMFGTYAYDNVGANNLGTEPLHWFGSNNLGNYSNQDPVLDSYISGDRLEAGNSYTDPLVASITADVLPGIQSQFINSGTLSSPEAARASSEGVTEAIAPELFRQYQIDEQLQYQAATDEANRFMQGGALQQQAAGTLGDQALQGRGLQQQAAAGASGVYQNDFANMMQGMALAPQTYQGLFAPAQNLLTAGTTQQQLDQTQINDDVARWNFEQSLPWDMLNQYIGQVTGNYGGTSTLTQPYFTNPTQTALSTAGAVGSLAKL